MRNAFALLLLAMIVFSCQKPYEKTITESTKNAYPNECYNCIEISSPVLDSIDDSHYMPVHEMAIPQTDYQGKVNVVKHTFSIDCESIDTLTEVWVFSEDFNRAIFISKE